jgi:hypothetical protein
MAIQTKKALTLPTVCALTGFSTVEEALKIVPNKRIPFVMLRASGRHGRVLHAQEHLAPEAPVAPCNEPDFMLSNARSLKLRVFVLCDRFTDLSPHHRACVSHVVCASSTCAAVVPHCNDVLWLDLETMNFAFLLD